MQGKAYWISPKGKIIKIGTKHINYIMMNLDEFGLTREEFNKYFEKYGEKYGWEGKGREELFIDLFKKGWIRIREWGGKGWTIELWELDKFSKNYIFDWAASIIEDGSSYGTKKVNIHLIKLEQAKKPQSQWFIETSIEKILKGELFEGKKMDKKILKNYGLFLNEAKMSRFIEHIKNYDSAILTAFRSKENCGEGREISKKENLARNEKLRAKLLLKKYGIINVKGVYIENFGSNNELEIEENGFFVFNLSNDPKFKNNIMKFAEEFEQDSILYIPKAEIDKEGNLTSYLISTNTCPNGYPGKGKIGKEVKFSKISIGSFNQFLTKLGKKPFYLKEGFEYENIINFNGNFLSGMGLQVIAEASIEKIIENFLD